MQPDDPGELMSRLALSLVLICIGGISPLAFADIKVLSERHSSGVGTEYVHSFKDNRSQNSIVFFQQRHDWNLNLNAKDIQVHCDYKLWIDGDRSETLDGVDFDNFEKLNLYADWMWHDVRFRVGNQEVTWGESPMITILDVVNPRNLAHPRGFYDPAAKIPQFMVNMEYQKENANYQVLLVPWPATMRQPKEVVDFKVAPTESYRPIVDGEYGLRFGYLQGEVDTKFYFLHHWPRVPSYVFRSWSADYDVEVQDIKQETIGTSASYAGTNWIMRGDLAYHNKYPSINISNEIERTGLAQGILGASWTTDQLDSFGTELHFDIWEKGPSAYSDTAFIEDKRGPQDIYWLGFNSSLNIQNQLLEPQIQYLKGINKSDEALRLIVIWNATDHLEVVGEYQKTDGDSGSPKLLLNQRDTLGLRLTWSF